MIRINPIKINNNTKKNISFTENQANNNRSSKDAIRALQGSLPEFQKNLAITQSADAVQSNPLLALGYKVRKAFNVLLGDHSKDPNQATVNKLYLSI